MAASAWTPVPNAESAWKPVSPTPEDSNPVVDFGKGVLKGALHTVSAADDWATQHLPAFMTTPIGQTPNHENSVRATQYAQDLAQTHNTSQAVGKGVEQVGEFFIPGGAEKALAGKGAGLATRAALSGLGSGVVNATQGGSFVGGTAAGVGGQYLTAGAKSLAPILAETALGVRATDRAFGRTPGRAILEETAGVRPGDIAKQASSKVAQYTGQLEDAAKNSTIHVDLQPAKSTADSWLKTAAKRNNPSTTKEVGQIGSQLDARGQQAISRFVSADEGLALRRGIDDLQTSWNPATVKDFSNRAVGATRSALANELEKAIPEYRNLNSKISTLLPVSSRAGSADLNAGVAQRVIGRFARPTGALIGGGLGATEGYREGGMAGAVAGGAAGLIAPEILASPTTLMMEARALNSGAIKTGAKALTAAGLQADREDAPVLKGEAKWASLGLAKLTDHVARDGSGISPEAAKTLQGTAKGRQFLIQASDLNPGSAAMKNLVKRIDLIMPKVN